MTSSDVPQPCDSEETNQTVPYLLDVQADLLDTLSTRVVVPLVAASAMGEKVSSLKDQRHEIIAALDFLFTGF
jgi:toxin CcdB